MNLGELLWGMLVFFFLFMAIWIFIHIFADIFHRDNLTGWGKAGWIVLIFIIPFIGALIYLIARPKDTEQDRRDAEAAMEAQRRLSGQSSSDEIAKAAALRDSGEITAEEYEAIKKRALMHL